MFELPCRVLFEIAEIVFSEEISGKEGCQFNEVCTRTALGGRPVLLEPRRRRRLRSANEDIGMLRLKIWPRIERA